MTRWGGGSERLGRKGSEQPAEDQICSNRSILHTRPQGHELKEGATGNGTQTGVLQ